MIRHILFDLDCTLYSVRYGLEENVMRRMMRYLASYLGTSVEEAAAERSRGMANYYGTTLEWLIAEKGFSADKYDDYMEQIHPADEADALPPDPELRRFLESLPCSCSILTNSPLFHAERIIKKLGLEGIFQRIFDIEGNGRVGKPHPSAYLRALEELSLKPGEALFVDDVPRYVEGFAALGGAGVLLDETGAHPAYTGERVKSLYELERFLK